MDGTFSEDIFNRAYWKSSLSLGCPESDSSSSRTANLRLDPALETWGLWIESSCGATGSASGIMSSKKELSLRLRLIPGLGDLSRDKGELRLENSVIVGDMWVGNWLIVFATNDKIGGDLEESTTFSSRCSGIGDSGISSILRNM